MDTAVAEKPSPPTDGSPTNTTHPNRSTPRNRRTATPHIEVRLATFEDAPAIAEFLGEFFHLSAWAGYLEYHQHKAEIYLTRALANNFVVYVLALDKDEIVGVCSYHVFDVFTNPMAVMDETYVVKRLQRTDLGRRLVAMVLALAKSDGCAVMNFPICSGMKEQNSLMNMVGKHFGAEPVGMIFRKVL